jgi:HD-GYP domain-containing protein (c-di-GMP phosphodiesterase class II)
MTSDRPYRKALTKEVAVAEIRKCSSTQFDPDVAGAFLRVAEKGNDMTGDRGSERNRTPTEGE